MRHSRHPFYTLILLASITLLCLPTSGCKRNKVGSAGGRLSPAAPNYQPRAPGEADNGEGEEQEDIAAVTAEQEALRALGPSTVGQEPDRGTGRPVAGSPEAAAVVAAANEEARAEYEARVKAHNDRVDTEKAVDAALQGVLPRLRDCYARHESKATSSTVSIRVNHLGYVLHSSANGANNAVNSCIREILGSVKVSGVKTGNITVQRSLNFQ